MSKYVENRYRLLQYIGSRFEICYINEPFVLVGVVVVIEAVCVCVCVCVYTTNTYNDELSDI